MKLVYKSLIFAIVMFLFGACSNSDKWEPGQSEGDTMGVYFQNLDNYDILIQADDSRTVTVNVARLETDDAAVVPIVLVSAPEGVKAPQTVEFNAGEETTSFELDLTDMPLKSSGDVVLKIDPAYATLYAAGTSQMTLKVTVTGGWIVLADNLVLDFAESTYEYPKQETKLYVLEGTQRFKIPDFMHSGLDFIFTVENPQGTSPIIVPYTNCRMYSEIYPDSDDDYNSWYLYDTANAQYPTWSPDGVSPAITAMMFYGHDDSRVYSYIRMDQGYGYLSSATDYDNGKYGYGDCELYFTCNFDPFAN